MTGGKGGSLFLTAMSMPGSWQKASSWLLLALLATLMTRCTDAMKYHYVHWNSSNPIFRIDNTDNVIDVNAGNYPWEYDQANLICPVYKSDGATAAAAGNHERYIIYNVSKEEYETCRITSQQPRVIAVCNNPTKVMYFTITFRSFTPTPGGMEFKPGKDYYFISTSADGDLKRRIGGRCSTHNMRLVFKVADNSNSSGSDSSDASSGKKNTVNIPRSELEGAQQHTISPSSDYYYPPREVMVSSEGRHNGLEEPATDKRDNGKVIKQEASRMKHSPQPAAPISAAGRSATNAFSIVIFVLASTLLWGCL